MKKDASTNNINKQELIAMCPLAHALSKIGNRWKPYILFKLIENDLRFKELKMQIPTITERMLTLALMELEKDQLVTRTDFKTYPRKVVYSVTASAVELHPVLLGICHWGEIDRQRKVE